MKEPLDKKFDLEHLYQNYLERVALKEADMDPEQKKQIKLAFMCACGQMLVTLRDDVSVLEENEVMKVLHNMIKQIAIFFLKELNEQD